MNQSVYKTNEQNEGTTDTQCKVETMVIMNVSKKVMFIWLSQVLEYIRSHPCEDTSQGLIGLKDHGLG